MPIWTWAKGSLPPIQVARSRLHCGLVLALPHLRPMPCGIILPWEPCFWASRANDWQTQSLGPYTDVGLAFWRLNPTAEVKNTPGHPSRQGGPASKQDEALPFLKFRPFPASAWTLTHLKRLMGKDPDAGTDWRREERGTTEDEMVGWHHRLNGHEFG